MTKGTMKFERKAALLAIVEGIASGVSWVPINGYNLLFNGFY